MIFKKKLRSAVLLSSILPYTLKKKHYFAKFVHNYKFEKIKKLLSDVSRF